MSEMTVRPYKTMERKIQLPNDVNSWPAVISNLILNQLSGQKPTKLDVRFKKVDPKTMCAIGSALVGIGETSVVFPIIVAGAKMYPLDVAMDKEGNRFPWHPLFVSLVPSTSLKLLSKQGNDISVRKTKRKRFIRHILALPKPKGFKQILKKAINDPRINVGFIKNGASEFINKALSRKEVARLKRTHRLSKVKILPQISDVPSDVVGSAHIVTLDGIKRAIGMKVLGNNSTLVVTSDGKIGYSPQFINLSAKGVKLASGKPYGYGIFYGESEKQYYCTPPVNITGKMGKDYVCMDNIGNSVIIKTASKFGKTKDGFVIGRNWKFCGIKGTAEPANHLIMQADHSKISKLGMAYYLDDERIGVGRDAAAKALSDRYSSPDSLIKAASQYGAIYVAKTSDPEIIEISCQPLIKDFAKIASMAPNQYSAAAILDVGFPIRESLTQMKQHLNIYQLAAAALANDVLLARLIGNPAEAEMSTTMHALCDAAMVVISIIRSLGSK